MTVEHIDGTNGPLAGDAPKHTAKDKGELLREEMLHWAKWSIAHCSEFTYTMGPGRSHMVDSAPGSLPQSADCSAFVTGLAKWAGASDPNGLNFHPVGFTGTLLDHCNRVTVSQARMGDLIVYGPDRGDHAVFIMERLPKNDFWLASHGHQGDPGRRLHSQMLAYFHGSARYLRWLS